MKRNKYVVRLLQIAENDLNGIITCVAAENRNAAEAIASRIEKTLHYLSVNPYLGKIPGEEELAGAGYRFIIVQNYLIFYTVEGHTILVHRIIHGARAYIHLL